MELNIGIKREWDSWQDLISQMTESVLRTGYGKVIINVQHHKIVWIERSETFKKEESV